MRQACQRDILRILISYRSYHFHFSVHAFFLWFASCDLWPLLWVVDWNETVSTLSDPALWSDAHFRCLFKQFWLLKNFLLLQNPNKQDMSICFTMVKLNQKCTTARCCLLLLGMILWAVVGFLLHDLMVIVFRNQSLLPNNDQNVSKSLPAHFSYRLGCYLCLFLLIFSLDLACPNILMSFVFQTCSSSLFFCVYVCTCACAFVSERVTFLLLLLQLLRSFSSFSFQNI